MAQNTGQQTGPDPDQLARQALVASHGVAHKAMQAHSDGLSKLMSAIQSMHGQAMQAQAGPPPGAMMPPDGGQGAGGDQQQAVWDAFPSTDPQSVQRMIEQAGSVEAAFPALAHLLEQDQQTLQEKWIDAVSQHLMQPSGPPDQGAAPANPGIGGEATGAYG